jgi:hypothetical protein
MVVLPSIFDEVLDLMVMICRGHVPVTGVGKNPFSIQADTPKVLCSFAQDPAVTNLTKVLNTLPSGVQLVAAIQRL